MSLKNHLDEKRDKLQAFLLKYSHYSEAQFVRGAKNRGLYSDSEDDNDVYSSIVRFSEFHNIKIHTPPLIKEIPVTETEYIEGTDEDGNSILKKLNPDVELQNKHSFIKLLEQQRDVLSTKLLKINNLIKIYEDN